MAREINQRDASVNKAISAQELVANRQLMSTASSLGEQGNYVLRALDLVRNIQGAMGQPAEFVADPYYQKTSSGSVAVHLQQQYKSIPIFLTAQTVRFAPNGTLQDTSGSSVTIDKDVEVSTKYSVTDAVRQAANFVAEPDQTERGLKDQFGESLEPSSVNVSGFVPKIIGSFPNIAEQPTVLEAGPFGDEIKASQIWFPKNNNLRLAWEVILTMPNFADQYRVIVDGQTGEILYSRQLSQTVAAQGNIYQVDGGSPRQMVNFPRPWQDYGLPIPVDLRTRPPDDWVTDAKNTVGNCANAHLGDSGPPLQGVDQGEMLTFNPADGTGDDQKVLNIFYYNCYLHDYFYLLGFREADGNFQQNNFDRGGIPGDAVDARAYSGAVWGTANMITPTDGSVPDMNMGLVGSTNRHTAFDATVVFHEFMHGVTNRLVGGPLNGHSLEEVQSRSMGEGWGDYIACTINNTTTVGAWVLDFPGGIRKYPYDSTFPDKFNALGTDRYFEIHNIGEIWCATLMELNRTIGTSLTVQLVVDALKLSPTNPSFLDMRDSILKALDHKRDSGQLSPNDYSTYHSGIWTVFAKFGMGPAAKCDGAQLTGIVADFNTPTGGQTTTTGQTGAPIHVEDTQAVPIPDNQPTGVIRKLTVQQAGKIKFLTVSLNIQHPYVGDLQVSLTPPGGSPVILYNQAWASAPNLVKSYRSDDSPALSGLVGQQAQGDWMLKVADLSAGDTGTLQSWSLDINPEAPTGAVLAPSGLTSVKSEAVPTTEQVMLAASEATRLASEATRLASEATSIASQLAPTGQVESGTSPEMPAAAPSSSQIAGTPSESTAVAAEAPSTATGVTTTAPEITPTTSDIIQEDSTKTEPAPKTTDTTTKAPRSQSKRPTRGPREGS